MTKEFSDLVDSFFENPLLRNIIEEAIQNVESDDDPTPSEEEAVQQASAETEPGMDKIQKLALDFQQGHLQQDDLINMYKAGQLSKEEIQAIVDMANSQEGQEGVPGGQEGAPEQPSEEELLAQQIEQTNDMFVKFAIYDKVSDLTTKLNYFHENFSDTETPFYERVLQLREFLRILSSLIFNLDTTVTYQMYGSILLQLTELFNEYQVEGGQEENTNSISKVFGERRQS
jgi:hypothetical protein